MRRIGEAKECGFTLAEVLVTLMIIGVVGAMTIPGFIAEHQKTVYVTALKKAYAIGNQALQKVAQEKCGSNDISCLFPASPDTLALGDAIASQYNVAKNCKTTANLDCWSKQVAQKLNNTNRTDFNLGSYDYRFVTNDGMSFHIQAGGDYKAACGNNLGLTRNSPTYKSCGYTYIDVNGKKGPNVYGRDVFLFIITSNKEPLLYPYGGKEHSSGWMLETEEDMTYLNEGGSDWWNYNNENKCSVEYTSEVSWKCAARIMENGWEMDY